MQTSILTLATIPLIGMVVILFLPFNNQTQILRGKQVGLLISILTFIESIRL